MEEYAKAPQDLHACPVCNRKFLKDRLEVHLKSCDKSGKYSKSTHSGNYDNKAFLDRLDAELEKEQKHSTYKSSKKKETNPNEKFLEKLESEMKKEEQHSSYVPYKPKKVNETKEEDINKKFLERLDAEIAKEEKNPTHTKTHKKTENKPENDQSDFMKKLEEEMEKDKQHPYVPYSQQKKHLKKLPGQDIEEVDSQKAFLAKLDEEMKKEDTYKPSNKINKKSKIDTPNKDFEKRVAAELDKEKNNAHYKQSSQLLCYLCFKEFNISAYTSHIRNCQINWQRNNIGKDVNLLKPDGLDELLKHISALKTEQIDNFNNNIFKNKDKMVFVPCENCARNIILFKMDEHLKTCQSINNTHTVTNTNSNGTNTNSNTTNTNVNNNINQLPNSDFQLVPCEQCGRKIASNRLTAHLRACKGKK